MVESVLEAEAFSYKLDLEKKLDVYHMKKLKEWPIS